MKDETTRHTIITIKSIYKNGIQLKSMAKTDVECCNFIIGKAVLQNPENIIGKIIDIDVCFDYLPLQNRSKAFIQKWIDFINVFGFNVTMYDSDKRWVTLRFTSKETESNYYNLLILSMIRYLYSSHYRHLPRRILNLRKRKDLSHLDNWEIFQLGHLFNFSFDDMSPIQLPTTEEISYITPIEFLNRRMKVKLYSNLNTFNVMEPHPISIKKLERLVKQRKWLEVYNILSTKHNNVNDKTYVKCIDNEGFIDSGNLIINNYYSVIRESNKNVLIADSLYDINLYNKSRFNFI
jgi:hypothetical protein